MKVILFIFAVVLCVGQGTLAGPLETRNLNDDFDDFASLIPTDQIWRVIVGSLNDPELQMVFEYILSEKFSSLVQEIEQLPGYNPVIDYLTDGGLPVKVWIKALHDFLGLPPPSQSRSSTRSLKDIVERIKSLIPFDKLIDLYMSKLVGSPSFKDFDKQIRENQTFRGFVKGIADNPKVVDIYNTLMEKGLEVDKLIAFVKNFYGWD